MRKPKRSLGRDVFEKAPESKRSSAVKRMIEHRAANGTDAKKVEVRVQLTPSNIKHLDALCSELERRGKGRFTRSELIRVAITLLSAGDF